MLENKNIFIIRTKIVFYMYWLLLKKLLIMKKNLFLLFSFYFFVLQSVFIWLLRWESKFYWLALVNCVFICLIAIFSKDNNQKVDENVQSKYGHEDVMKKNEWMKINHFWIFLISFLFWILVIFWLKDVTLYLRILLGIVWAIFVFMVWGLVFNYKSFRVWEWKFYLIMLILSLIWSIISLLNIDFSVFKFWDGEDSQDFSGWVIQEDEIIWELSDEIEQSWENLNLTWGESNLTWWDSIVEDENWMEYFLWEEETKIDEDVLATFADVIKYLLKDETLSTKTDLAFSYIWKSNPDYAYYRTAYEKKMIWKDLQPTKNLMCETYVVMKGLIEEWKVWTYSDIKQAYWNYAKNNWLLPSCQYWKYVTISDLK